MELKYQLCHTVNSHMYTWSISGLSILFHGSIYLFPCQYQIDLITEVLQFTLISGKTSLTLYFSFFTFLFASLKYLFCYGTLKSFSSFSPPNKNLLVIQLKSHQMCGINSDKIDFSISILLLLPKIFAEYLLCDNLTG